MSWIKIIPYSKAKGSLLRLYDKIKGPNNNIDNVLLIHSLRPHSLTGHMSLYKNVLHNSNNCLPKWYLESIGVYVSFLNDCQYCIDHHFSGLKRLLKDDKKANEFYKAVINNSLDSYFNSKLYSGMAYSKKLTLALQNINKNDVNILKEVGFTDGEILEINQVTGYFNYANRTVLGLGVTTDGDIIGLSPNDSDDPNNWNHN
jgi:uncharacterized peroxidase-related enzyme